MSPKKTPPPSVCPPVLVWPGGGPRDHPSCSYRIDEVVEVEVEVDWEQAFLKNVTAPSTAAAEPNDPIVVAASRVPVVILQPTSEGADDSALNTPTHEGEAPFFLAPSMAAASLGRPSVEMYTSIYEQSASFVPQADTDSFNESALGVDFDNIFDKAIQPESCEFEHAPLRFVEGREEMMQVVEVEEMKEEDATGSSNHHLTGSTVWTNEVLSLAKVDDDDIFKWVNDDNVQPNSEFLQLVNVVVPEQGAVPSTINLEDLAHLQQPAAPRFIIQPAASTSTSAQLILQPVLASASAVAAEDGGDESLRLVDF